MIGALRHRVELLRPVEVADGAGGYSETWQSAGRVWASVSPVSAGDELLNDAAQHVTRHAVTIRFHPSITASWRIVFRGRELEVDGVQNIGERDEYSALSALETA